MSRTASLLWLLHGPFGKAALILRQELHCCCCCCCCFRSCVFVLLDPKSEQVISFIHPLTSALNQQKIFFYNYKLTLVQTRILPKAASSTLTTTGTMRLSASWSWVEKPRWPRTMGLRRFWLARGIRLKTKKVKRERDGGREERASRWMKRGVRKKKLGNASSETKCEREKEGGMNVWCVRFSSTVALLAPGMWPNPWQSTTPIMGRY